MTTDRRAFVMATLLGGAGFPMASQAQANVDERDPQAMALGYVSDASHADFKKFPKYAPGQNCAGCALYQGAAGSAAGNCPLYAGKLVSAKGWCGAFVKKA